MKPAPFDYARAGSASEAVALHAAAAGGARFLAGGQSLIPALALRLDAPDVLIDLGGAVDLCGIARRGDRIVIGAMTRHAEIEADPLVARHLPLLAQAVRHVAHPAIRNRGTIGGSLALADPAAEAPACALALGAELRLLGPEGARVAPADDFFLGLYETARAPGEVLAAIEIPIPPAGARSGFGELARRKGDYAMAGVAVQGGPAPRVAWFGVADRAVRDPAAERALAARASVAAIVEASTEGMAFASDPSVSAATRRHLARVLLGRVLRDGGLA